MHYWVEHEKPEYMDIAFNSDRSIEDELDKEFRFYLCLFILSAMSCVFFFLPLSDFLSLAFLSFCFLLSSRHYIIFIFLVSIIFIWLIFLIYLYLFLSCPLHHQYCQHYRDLSGRLYLSLSCIFNINLVIIVCLYLNFSICLVVLIFI